MRRDLCEFTYVNQNINMNDWQSIEAELKKIMVTEITSSEDLINIIYWYNELKDEVEYIDIQNYVKFSLDMNNSHVKDRLSDFRSSIKSPCVDYFHQIEEKIRKSAFYHDLDRSFDHYKNLLKRNSVLTDKRNTELLAKEEDLCLAYRKAVSGVSITYNGKKYTRSEAIQLLDQVAGEKKKKVWIQINEAWLSNKPELDRIFDDLLRIRHTIAQNCGLKNYADYLHIKHSRFGYTLEDMQDLHKAVEMTVVPGLRSLVGPNKTYPWADNVKEIPKAFSSAYDLVEKMKLGLSRIDNDFYQVFVDILDKGNIDLKPRPGKTTGGFSFPIDRQGNPFICMNVAGRPKEVSILIHEIGHGVHAKMNACQKIRDYRMYSSNGELAEFPPKFFELLGLGHYDVFYNEAGMSRAIESFYIDLLESLNRYIIIDAFEHWVYSNPNHTVRQRDDYYRSLVDRFNVNDQWEGYEDYKCLGWYSSQLIAIMPFYIVSYAVAQIGAMKLYRLYLEKPEETISNLKKMLTLGFSKPLSDLYKVAGINFDFSMASIEGCISFVTDQLSC